LAVKSTSILVQQGEIALDFGKAKFPQAAALAAWRQARGRCLPGLKEFVEVVGGLLGLLSQIAREVDFAASA